MTRNILPIPTAHCGAAAADCAAGIAPPRTQAERDAQRNQGADLASDISTQAGRFAAAATAYGTYLASQPNAAAQGVAAIQFGMAWTATIAGFGAAAFEQALRPDFGQSTIDMSTSIFGDLLGKTAPIASPITNEIIEKIKNTQEVINWRDKLNGKS
ncbi:hypothetical protein QN379_17870 [Glaciimonas sp. Gout2]|uniref:hypothetical protein n=1 Tax=unclassified Glaciimonas TaxID=2644401 RepID=UPI002B230F45|nr:MULTISPECIES: hypothetical protein [unclassified Glaciimonas]MEB0012123.1 hypothetical protein [Glaciimonas sp. Cout2]MEB0083879.1 hypothetical protein [Glaciimonas sp. Gout2]